MKVLRVVVLGIASIAAIAMAGCGGGDGSAYFHNVSERSSWGFSDTLAFVSFGGNGQKYVWRCSKDGGSQVPLTIERDTTEPTNEGGFNPTFRPGQQQAVFSSRRAGGSVTLYVMDGLDGDRKAITALTNSGVAGQDIQANYSVDGNRIVYVTDKVIGGGTGTMDIVIMNADGSSPAYEVATDAIEQWPCFNPDGTKIAFNRGPSTGPTDIIIRNISTDEEVNLTAALRTGIGSATRFECPAWGVVGGEEWIYFHSNRAGDFDLYRVRPDGSSLQQITSDLRSDGFPVLSTDATTLIFTRDRELWSRSAVPGATEETRLTRRY